jgi:phosphatidate cytidylyltransferase
MISFRDDIIGMILFLSATIFIFGKCIDEFYLFFSAETQHYKTTKLVVKSVGILLGWVVFAGIRNDFHFFMILGIWLSGVFVVFVFHVLFSMKEPETLKRLFFTFAPLFLFIIPLSFIIPVYVKETGKTLLFFIAVIKAGDIGGYVIGTVSGKLMKGGNHKMSPVISPNKSWEGFFGGLIFSLLVSSLLTESLSMKWNYNFSVFLGMLLYLGGVCGDLFESSLKRMASVKDSSGMIPGIGGVLDTIDSLLVNAPLFYFIVNFYVK